MTMGRVIIREVLGVGMRAMQRHGVLDSLFTKVEAREAVKEATKPPLREPATALAIPSTLPPGSTEDLPIVKPGCTAADESILVHGHLTGLANGQGGFGLLRESKKHIDRAVKGAAMMGDPETSRKLAHIAGELPNIHDEETAAKVAAELEPLLPVTWELGKRCGGTALPPELLEKVTRLAQAVKDGKISREDAVKELRDGQPRS